MLKLAFRMVPCLSPAGAVKQLVGAPGAQLSGHLRAGKGGAPNGKRDNGRGSETLTIAVGRSNAGAACGRQESRCTSRAEAGAHATSLDLFQCADQPRRLTTLSKVPLLTALLWGDARVRDATAFANFHGTRHGECFSSWLPDHSTIEILRTSLPANGGSSILCRARIRVFPRRRAFLLGQAGDLGRFSSYQSARRLPPVSRGQPADHGILRRRLCLRHGGT